MREADYDRFSSMLEDVWAFYPTAKAPTAGQKAIFFRALVHCSLDAVRSGFDAHVKDPTRGRFAPLPADIIAQIDGTAKDDGRPGPEEAWAIVQHANDEAKTIVWTPEMAEAWGIAKPVSDNGDDVGARMAFKEVYVRLVAAARAEGRPLLWQPSIGHDPKHRDSALQLAHAAGLLGKPEPLAALPAPDNAMSPTNGSMPAHVREQLAALRTKLVSKSNATSIDPHVASGPQHLADGEWPLPDCVMPPGMRSGSEA